MDESKEDKVDAYECLMERLQFMAINNAYLFLLPEPQINHNISEWECPEELRLVAKMEDGNILKGDSTQNLSQEKGMADIISWKNRKNMAVYTIYADLNYLKEICDRIVGNSKMFNESSDKPYNIEMSIGYVVYKWSRDLDLNHMLSRADKMLYESKKKKRKDVRKM